MYDIRLVAILTANDDGSQAANPSTSAIRDSVQWANRVYNPHGVAFLFDPATDIYRLNDDYLNRDSRRRDHQVYTDEATAPDGAPEFEAQAFNDRRNEVARRFPGRAVIYFTMGGRYFWSTAEKRWVYGPRGFSWSNHFDEFVSMAAHGAGGDLMAHELGHFLHLPHTFGYTPATIADAAALIRQHVDNGGSKDTALGLFDGDGLADTPPDPGPQLFQNQCDPAESSVAVPVTFSDGSARTYTLAPDRENIMSYWNKTCRGGIGRISAQQSGRVRSALLQGNRRHLLTPAVLSFATAGLGDRSQTRAVGWAFEHVASRFDAELAAGRRCVHLEAYDAGGGQIRWDAVWERGDGSKQSRALGWALTDFANRFDEELKAGRRCVHMQAYDLGGGQIRWDGIWASGGDRGQSRAIGWAAEHFVGRFDQELSSGRKLVHMQAYDLGGGQIRWDAVWEKAEGAQQTRVFGASIGDFAKRFDDELAAGRRCVHMQAYRIAGGQIRWDGVWESGGAQGQSRAIGWAFNDLVSRWDQEAAAGRRLVHLQALDIGGGNLRFDAIWQAASGPQKRVLGLPLASFADHLDELVTAGWHIETMTSVMRRYPDVPVATAAKLPAAAARPVSFGSDADGTRPELGALPLPPVAERDPGCTLS